MPFGRVLTVVQAELLLKWLETEVPWKLKVARFYEQYEYSIEDSQPPERLDFLFGSDSIRFLVAEVERVFSVKLSSKVEITAHRLNPGQRIRIHNDYIPGQETHRLLIQMNRGWLDENGGLLMLFSSKTSEDLKNIYRPDHNSGVLFEISPISHHAVSAIRKGERFTLVFSFFSALPASEGPS